MGVGLTHTVNLIIKKLRVARETGDLEAVGVADTGEIPMLLGNESDGDTGEIPIGVADTGEIPMLLGNESDGEAARGPREPSLVLDEAEGLPRGNGRPVYDPNRGRLHRPELYALVHVIVSDTNIQVYLHKKY